MVLGIGTGGRLQAEWLLKRNRFKTTVEQEMSEAKFGKPDPEQEEYQPIRDTVLDLCDVIMQYKSPKAKDEPKPRYEMGGYVAPSFEPLICLASHLVRCMHTDTIDRKSSTFMTFRNSQDSEEQPRQLEEKIMIEEDTWWWYYTDPDLFDIVIKNQYSPTEYGKGLAHLCYGKAKLSRQVCEIIMKNVVKDFEHI